MGLSSRHIFLATVLLATTSHFALAQDMGSSPSMAQPAPSNSNTVAPAPTLAPLISPREQAERDARAAAEAAAQQAAQQAAAQQKQQAAGQPLVAQPIVAPVVTPAIAAPTPSIPAAPPQESLQQLAAQNPAPVEQLQPQPAPSATATAVNTTPAEQPVKAPQATTTQGFKSQDKGAVMPINTGQMPVTNAGMNMDINPDIVGGMEPSTAGTDPNNPEAAVPYEVQLQQRTEEIQARARAIAFEQAKKSVLPMEPNEIHDVLSRLKDTQEAVQTPVRPAPKAGNVIRTISTDPSEKPKTIHLWAGNVTTLNIIDVTGEPWPIVDIGFGGNFDVKPPEPGGHVIRITPMRDFARGNLVVRLLKMTTPITFSLRAGGDTVDYRFDARIPEYGPNAKMPLIDDGIGSIAGDNITTSFLEGVPPSTAEKLTVDGVDGSTSAYRFAGAMYVRTPLNLLSPAWQGSATSSDGMNVYVLDDAPVLLLSDKGNLVRARIGQAQKTVKE